MPRRIKNGWREAKAEPTEAEYAAWDAASSKRLPFGHGLKNVYAILWSNDRGQNFDFDFKSLEDAEAFYDILSAWMGRGVEFARLSHRGKVLKVLDEQQVYEEPPKPPTEAEYAAWDAASSKRLPFGHGLKNVYAILWSNDRGQNFDFHFKSLEDAEEFYDILVAWRDRGVEFAELSYKGKVLKSMNPRRQNPRTRRRNPRSKKRSGPGSYPWDECIKDQLKRYGDMDAAKNVCGSIRAKSRAKYPGYWAAADAMDARKRKSKKAKKRKKNPSKRDSQKVISRYLKGL